MRVAGLFIAMCATGALLTACDETHSFVIKNETADQIEVTISSADEDEPERLFNTNHYVLESGAVIDTGTDEDESGDRGERIFYNGRLLVVTASSEGRVIFERTFTYDELKALNFDIAITD